LKILIAVITCHSQTHFQQAIRDTWLSQVPPDVDVRFFSGAGATREPKEDEVFLESAPDDYFSLPEKVQCVLKWAYERGYDYALKLDNDVVIKPKELLSSGFDQHDFVGARNHNGKIEEIHTPWGFAYWLSRRAMKLVIDSPLPGRPGSTHNYYHANDEAWISTVLYKNLIFLHDDQRYFLHQGKPSRPMNRPLRAPRRIGIVAPPGTFAWCMYLDFGQHTKSVKEILEEFRTVYEAQNEFNGRASEGTEPSKSGGGQERLA
jgi:hypothetical protein